MTSEHCELLGPNRRVVRKKLILVAGLVAALRVGTYQVSHRKSASPSLDGKKHIMTLHDGTNAHEYVLGRDYLASARLNLQHYLWTREVGYHLHPKIPSVPDGALIADVATGSGYVCCPASVSTCAHPNTRVWAMDLATTMPTIEFHGFDIDLAPAPPAQWLPPNLTLQVFDVFEPPPQRLIGRFHVVHLRLLMCVIRDDPRPVLQNLIALLAPGGYLQWGEMDPSTTRFEAASRDVSTNAIEAAGKFPASLRHEDSRMDATWVTGLGAFFKEAGLDVIADDHAFRKECNLRYYTDVAFMVWEEWRTHMSLENQERYAIVLEEARKARENCNGGLAINMEIRTVVGRKRLI